MSEPEQHGLLPKQMPDKQNMDSTTPSSETGGQLLGANDIRQLAERAGIKPTKKLGQNFVTDPGTVRRIVRTAQLQAGQQVVEVGPGLGSLTLGLLEAGAAVSAIEIDPLLANLLPDTVARHMPQATARLKILNQDALTLEPQDCENLTQATSLTLVSNLPYNVATPIILTLLERFNNLNAFVVMVQKEVAERLVAQPGSKVYGVPSAKLAWYGKANMSGNIGPNVFWPIPNVDSALVSFKRSTANQHPLEREHTFRIIDAAFAQRRKTLRAALRNIVDPLGFERAGIDPQRRGETLNVQEFTRLAKSSESYSHDTVNNVNNY
jgi:16S rRNA (adenine1518-N6/adenine1519-N6)-dimethyltransferase